MIRLENVSKSFQGESVIRSINFVIDEGETTILIGPSGCGKSTLLKLMIGLIIPDNGEIQCFGDTLSKTNIFLIRQRIGYVIQHGGLFPNLTARDNVIIMARQNKWSDSKIQNRLSELKRLTSFEDRLLNHFPAQLSGGQQQRVALMRALMLDPEILLLDEPLGALDPMIRYELQVDLQKIFRELGKTTVMVTHDLSEAAYFSDNVILIRNGKIVQQGTIQNMIDKPADSFVTRFIKAQREISLMVNNN